MGEVLIVIMIVRAATLSVTFKAAPLVGVSHKVRVACQCEVRSDFLAVCYFRNGLFCCAQIESMD